MPSFQPRHWRCVFLVTSLIPLTLGIKEDQMFANVVMLVLFYGVLVIPVLWALRPARLVTPY